MTNERKINLYPQIAPDCGDSLWDHVEVINEYEGGRIGRHSIEKVLGAEK